MSARREHPDVSGEEIPAGSEVGVGPTRLAPHEPFVAALRHALGGATAAVVSMTVDGDGPRDVIGLLPPLSPQDVVPAPPAVGDAVAGHLPPDADVSVARLSWSAAVAAVQVAPPIGGGDVESLLADAARSPRGLERMWRRLGDKEVWVPVEGLPDLDAAPAVGGALQVASVPPGVAVPTLPVLERDGHPAVHAFSGPWQLLHADPPFGAAVRVTATRLAAALPDRVALAIDVGCLHATLLAQGPHD